MRTAGGLTGFGYPVSDPRHLLREAFWSCRGPGVGHKQLFPIGRRLDAHLEAILEQLSVPSSCCLQWRVPTSINWDAWLHPTVEL